MNNVESKPESADRLDAEPLATTEVTGLRTQLYATLPDVTREQSLVIGLRVKVDEEGYLDGLVLAIEEGGPTGYESFNIDEYANWPRMIRHGWTACAGTAGRWDRLVIPGPEMRRIHDWVASLLNSLDI